jgi:hypothetical protein
MNFVGVLLQMSLTIHDVKLVSTQESMRSNWVRVRLGVRAIFTHCSRHPFESPEYMESGRRNLDNYLRAGLLYAWNHRRYCDLQAKSDG